MNGKCLATLALAASATVGCANVHVKKVSVEKRLEGTDHHVKGFRYYVSRPYVVVDQAIPVATTQWMARLVQVQEQTDESGNRTKFLPPGLKDPALASKDGKFAGAFLLEGVAPEQPVQGVLYYDLAGHPVAGVDAAGNPVAITRKDYHVTTVKVTAAPAKADTKTQPPVVPPPVVPPPGTATPVPPTPTPVPPTPAGVPAVPAIPPVVKPPGADPKGALKPKATAPGLLGAAQAPRDAQVGRTQGPGSSLLSPNDTAFPASSAPAGSGVLGAAQAVQVLSNAAQPPAGTPAPAPAAPNPDDLHFQVVFLPDFEEQMAITHRNFAATNKYQLHFNDGWELNAYSGNFNATQVPVAILQTLQSILGSVASYESAAIKPKPTTPAAPGAADIVTSLKVAITPNSDEYWFYLQKVMQIEPGVYRVQKSWEKVGPPEGAIAPPVASGLLSDLGIPVVETIQVNRVN